MPNGPWTTVGFFSLGTEVMEFMNNYAIQFICKVLSENLKIGVPKLRLKFFYLAELPVATTEEGHVMSRIGGFTSIENRRIEINIHPPFDYEQIFNSMVHEILHVCVLEDSNINDPEAAESRIKSLQQKFSKESEAEYRSNKDRILESVQGLKAFKG